MELEFGQTPTEVRRDVDGDLIWRDEEPVSLGVNAGMLTCKKGEEINFYKGEDGKTYGGAVAILLWREGKNGKEYLLNKRSNYKGPKTHAPRTFSIPTGKAGVSNVKVGWFSLEVPEDPYCAALREVREETGIEKKEIIEFKEFFTVVGGTYPSDKNGEPISEKSIPLWVKMYGMEVDNSAEIKKSEESEELKWVSEKEFFETLAGPNVEPYSRIAINYIEENGLRGHKLTSNELEVVYG